MTDKETVTVTVEPVDPVELTIDYPIGDESVAEATSNAKQLAHEEAEQLLKDAAADTEYNITDVSTE